MTIAVVNPLPAALAHYAVELGAVLEQIGVRACIHPSPSIERQTGGSTFVRAGQAVRWRRTFRKSTDDAIVLWPAFGLLEPLMLRRSGARTWLVVHDPVPLRRQFGMGVLGVQIGRLGLKAPMTVLVHSEPAQAVLSQRGWPTVRVPHPILPPSGGPFQRGGMVRVLGQWKPARSQDALTNLASEAEWEGRRQICGRGWPPTAGWEVESRFLTEAELNDRISGSAAVVLPYTRYYQSGIAIRCLERGVPVVGQPHPFLAELYGADWIGTVKDGDWAGAVRRAVDVPVEAVHGLHVRYSSGCVEAWRQLFERVSGEP